MGEAPQETEACWTCGGEWEDCRHGETPLEAYRRLEAQDTVLAEVREALAGLGPRWHHPAEYVGRWTHTDADASRALRQVMHEERLTPTEVERIVEAFYEAYPRWRDHHDNAYFFGSQVVVDPGAVIGPVSGL